MSNEQIILEVAVVFVFIGAYVVGWLKGHAEGRHKERLEELSRRAKGL